LIIRLAKYGSHAKLNSETKQRTLINSILLQLVLQRWWGRDITSSSSVLTLKTLQEIDDQQGLLNQHFERCLRALNENEREACLSFLPKMMVPTNQKIAVSESANRQVGAEKLPARRRCDVPSLVNKLVAPSIGILKR